MDLDFSPRRLFRDPDLDPPHPLPKKSPPWRISPHHFSLLDRYLHARGANCSAVQRASSTTHPRRTQSPNATRGARGRGRVRPRGGAPRAFLRRAQRDSRRASCKPRHRTRACALFPSMCFMKPAYHARVQKSRLSVTFLWDTRERGSTRRCSALGRCAQRLVDVAVAERTCELSIGGCLSGRGGFPVHVARCKRARPGARGRFSRTGASAR